MRYTIIFYKYKYITILKGKYNQLLNIFNSQNTLGQSVKSTIFGVFFRVNDLGKKH